MRNVFLALITTTYAASALFAQAPPGWTRLSEAKDLSKGAAKAMELGVWKSPDSDLRVQLIQCDPINTAQGVWNLVGGVVSGLSKSGQQPTSSEIATTGKYLAFHFHGNVLQAGTNYSVETYVIFARSHSYILKAFTTDTAPDDFTITEWDLGEPITTERDECNQALSQIKARLDAHQTLNAPSPTPDALASADEDFASAKDATEADFRTDLRVWTSMIDIEKQRAANILKKSGERVDVDTRQSPLLRRLAKNPFFNIDREEALHPAYRHELSIIAALRGQTFRGTSPTYQLGYIIARNGLPLALIIFVISRWTRRVSRKRPPKPGVSRSAYYAKLLLKMSWRVALLGSAALITVVVIHVQNIFSQDEFTTAVLSAIGLLIISLPLAMLITSWSSTKRKFSAGANAPPPIPSP
jgi:hypothetical protein